MRPRNDQDISRLIADLGTDSGSTRHAARSALVKAGASAVPALIEALSARKHSTRWGAAKTLGQIQDPRAAPALVAALEDDDSDVRWLASGALVKLRDDGLRALLTAMSTGQLALHHDHAAHHVLHDFVEAGREDVAPVLEALESSSLETATPLAAAQALAHIR